MDEVNTADVLYEILKDKPEFEIVKSDNGKHISVRTKGGYLLSVLYSIKDGRIAVVGLHGEMMELYLGDPDIEKKLVILLTQGARKLP